MSIHHIRTKFGDRTFSVASPTVRNSLPESVRSAETLASSSASWKPNLLLSFINIVTPSRSVVGWALNYPRIVLSCVISSKKIQGNDRQQLRQKYAMKLIWGPIFNKWWNQSYTIFVLILRQIYNNANFEKSYHNLMNSFNIVNITKYFNVSNKTLFIYITLQNHKWRQLFLS